MKIYSAYNEAKSAAAEGFIIILEKEKYKYMNLISKNVYIIKSDDTVKYNNT